MGFEEQVRVVWRHRFWLLALSLLAAIAVFVLASLRTSTYTTSAVIGVTPGRDRGQTVNNDTRGVHHQVATSDSSAATPSSPAARRRRRARSLQDMRERVCSSSDPDQRHRHGDGVGLQRRRVA